MAQLARHPAFVGIRPMIQDIVDPNWMLEDALTHAFHAIEAFDLTFDALTLPTHLKNLLVLLKRYPDLRVVIDHDSKPYIRDLVFNGWAEDMAALARDTNAYCKLSGLVTEAAPDWSTETLRPYVDHLLNIFGPEHLIWGSDWPVCTLASTYERWLETTDALLAALSDEERSAIPDRNSEIAYRLHI